MDDPRHVAEHARGHEEPAAPEEISGARAIGALRAGVYHDAGDQCDDRERDEPRDLTDELAVEETEQSWRAAEPRATTPAVHAAATAVDAEAAAEKPEDAREPVVPE